MYPDMNEAAIGPARVAENSPPGSADDFDAYVRASERRHKRLAFLLTGDLHEAEDLLQAAYAKIYPRWDEVRTYDVPDAYLRRVMVTQRTSWWRRTRNREWSTADLPERAHPGADPSGVVTENQALLVALRRLPERQRVAVVLRHWCDLSEAETAAAMSCSLGTVKSSTSRGLAHLRAAAPPVVTTPDAKPSQTIRLDVRPEGTDRLLVSFRVTGRSTAYVDPATGEPVGYVGPASTEVLVDGEVAVLEPAPELLLNGVVAARATRCSGSTGADTSAWQTHLGEDGFSAYRFTDPDVRKLPAEVEVRRWSLTGNTLTLAPRSTARCAVLQPDFTLGRC